MVGPLGVAEAQRLKLFLSVEQAILEIARARATLLAFEDLHWIDAPSLELLWHIVYSVAEAAARGPVPLLIVATYRPEEADERLRRCIARLTREPICQTLPLDGFGSAETRNLIEALGVTRPSNQLVTAVHEATAGNPLFIQEALHHLDRRGELEARAGYTASVAPNAELELPADVAGAIAERARGLGDECRRVLTLASLLGQRFEPRVLAEVAQLDRGELLKVARRRVARELTQEERRRYKDLLAK